MNYVFYHANCYDGFGSYWAAKQYDKDVIGIPAQYGKPIDFSQYSFNFNDSVFFLDFSIPKDQYIELSKTTDVYILDHHESAALDFLGDMPHLALFKKTGNIILTASFLGGKGHGYVFFDMSRSGAGITWDYFNGAYRRPQMINLIEDRDLWKFKFKETEAFHAYLLSLPMDLEAWNELNQQFSNAPDMIIEKGQLLLKMSSSIVDNICKEAHKVTFLGHEILTVNTSSHWSEVGNKLLDMGSSPFALCYTVKNNFIMGSLRSRQSDGFDVSLIAKQLGGGGHKTASGFRMPVVEFMTMLYGGPK